MLIRPYGVTPQECAQFGLPAAHVIAYHYICEGQMVLELDNHEPVVVESGEIDALRPERIWQETVKALGEERPGVYFEVLRQKLKWNER